MLKDFVLDTCNAPGTATTINLAGPPAGRLGLTAFANGATLYYYMDDGTQAEWGSGVVTYGAPNTFARNTVIGNTAGTTARMNFAGSTRVYNEIPSARMVFTNSAATIPLGGAAFDLAAGKGTTPIGSGMDFWGAAAPAGWLFSFGQAINRTTYAALFAVLGTTYGVGDGTTTFNLPDKRGRVSAPRDDMGGVSAARVSTVLASTTLGASGGHQDMPAHAHGVTDPTHNHGINNPTHAHGVTDPTHNHGLNNPTHGHGVTDPGHVHSYTGTAAGGGDLQTGALAFATVNTGSATTGLTVNAAATAITANAAATGVTVNAVATAITANAVATGLTVNSAGTGSGQNVQPSIICNYIIFSGV